MVVSVRFWACSVSSSGGGSCASVRKLSMESASDSGQLAHFEDLELGDKDRDVTGSPMAQRLR